MRIVLATHSFDGVGGSEVYLLTLAEQLLRLGHGVTIYAVILGKMAELARARAIDIAPEAEDLSEHSDVAITQDVGVSYELAARWPRTPQVFVCHSSLFDFQLPPLVPEVVGAVVVLSNRVERRIRALDIPCRIVRLRQPIDTERLVPRSVLHDRPRRALLLGNYLRGDARQVLVGAWTAAGVEVVQVGAPATISLHPEEDIAKADIVVGKGRAILDAMSCGRAAYVYDAFGTDGWVTPEVYPLMEADAFAGQALPLVVDLDKLHRDLDEYRPLMGRGNRELIMNHHQARTHAEQIVDLCRELAPTASPNTTARRELARMVRLKWRAEAELFALRSDFAPVAAEAAKLEQRGREQEAEIESLRHQFGEMREELERSSEALAEAGAYVRHLEADLRARGAALADADQALQAARAERDAAAAAAERVRAERDAAAAAAKAACAENDARGAALEEAGSYARHVEADLAATTLALSEAGTDARSLNAQLTAVLNSTSWRLSGPLRAIVNYWRTTRVLQRRAPLPACVPVQDQILTQISVPAALAPPHSSPSSPIEADHKAPLTSNAKTNLKDFLAFSDRINFFEAGSPDISVLIVLWNQAHLTLRCLRALHTEMERPGSASLEIVLVDNASSDETEELISRLDGVHVIRNASNLGYVRAANQAAAASRGRILLFLNSDAFVRPGALRAAQAALESAPDIGVVGGRLILPSGLLQEAGSIIWSDGSTLGYGRGSAADIGEVMFRREVDYCSAAFLMTPRGLWQKLGGYDEVYAPNYYEDTDYCERVWEAGFRVLYEPTAVVDHYEFGSEANPGEANAVSLVNRKRFRARHAKRLRVAHLPFAPTNVLAARERYSQGWRRLLIFDNEVPLRALGSGYPRMREILVEAAKANWSVSFFPLHQLIVDWDAVRSEIPREIEILSGRAVPDLAKFLEERRGHYDVVLVSRPDNMALILAVLRERPHLMDGTWLVYDAEALFAARKIGQATFEGRPLPAGKADQMINDEVALAEAADAIICVTEAEAKEFRNRLVASVHVLSHSTTPRFDAPGFEGRRGFLFVGRLLEHDTPNWHGLSWFIRKVWPLIRGKLPEATLVVAGQLHADACALEAPGVQLLGPVPNLSPLYDAARVFVAPINFAGGLPHKITEATEAGLPTAATRLMARQLAWTPGTEIAAEDKPRSLAAVALALHEKETVWTAMREAAQQRLLRDHGAEEFRKRLYAVLDERLSD